MRSRSGRSRVLPGFAALAVLALSASFYAEAATSRRHRQVHTVASAAAANAGASIDNWPNWLARQSSERQALSRARLRLRRHIFRSPLRRRLCARRHLHFRGGDAVFLPAGRHLRQRLPLRFRIALKTDSIIRGAAGNAGTDGCCADLGSARLIASKRLLRSLGMPQDYK